MDFDAPTCRWLCCTRGVIEPTLGSRTSRQLQGVRSSKQKVDARTLPLDGPDERRRCVAKARRDGASLKTTLVLAMLQWQGTAPSLLRPRISDGNACAESLFHAAKYRPDFPVKGMARLDGQRARVAEFVALVRRRSPPQQHPRRQPAAASRR